MADNKLDGLRLTLTIDGNIIGHEIMRYGLREIVRQQRARPFDFTGEEAAQMAEETLRAAESHEVESEPPGVPRA